MARVLIPTNPRRYNENAPGATTTIVSMKAHNPFESGRAFLAGPAVQSRGRVMLAGLGLDYDSSDTMTPEVSDTGSGFDWGSAFSTGADVVSKLGVPLITGLLTKPAVTVNQAAPVVMTQAPLTQRTLTVPAAPSSKLPWIIGGVAAVGVVLLLVLRKRK